MSIDAIKHVLGTSKARGAERMVLVVIAESIGPDGTCWPGLPTIAGRAALSETRTRKAVETLERAGSLMVEERAGTSHRYAIPGVAVTVEFNGREPKPEPARNAGARYIVPLHTGEGVNTGTPLNTGNGVLPHTGDRVSGPKWPDELPITPLPVLTPPLHTGAEEPLLNRKDNALPVPVQSSNQNKRQEKDFHVHTREGAPAQVAQAPPTPKPVQTPEEQEEMRLKVAAVINAAADKLNANWSKRT